MDPVLAAGHVLAGRPKVIAWMSGWISDEAWCPMMCAPRIFPESASTMIFAMPVVSSIAQP